MQPGTRIGPYEVVAAIGRGGMGEVWRARDERLDRDVAIKTLPDEFANDADRLARFGREAKILASLSHDNIAAIYGLEDQAGKRFLVLELVEGDTLAERLRRGPIPVDETIKLALQIAGALEAAHEKGIIHRDLKPANVKVTNDGKVKVLDFGLAKAFSDESADGNTSNSPTLSMAATAQGLVLGTAAYMSPEQTKGRSTDRRADIWAFGCVLYEMLTGRAAFQGDDISDILASVLKTSPEWTALPSNIHPRLAELVQRCLEKDRRNRFQDVGDIRMELERVHQDPSGKLARSATIAMPAPRSSWSGMAAVAFVTAILVATTTWVLNPAPPASRSVTRFTHEPRSPQCCRNTGRPVFALSPDGRRFVYNTSDGLYVRSMDELNARIIPGTEPPLTNPFFSADGQWIGYFYNGQLMKMAVTGGSPVPLTGASNPFGAHWASDGTILFGQPDGIRRVSANGGASELIVKGQKGELLHGPQLLPGGKSVLFTATTAVDSTRWDKADIVVESLDTHDRVVVWKGGSDARYLPTGHLVYALQDGLFVLPFDVNQLRVTGGAISIAEGVMRSAGAATGTANYGISDDGSLAFLAGPERGLNNRSVVWVDRNGREEIISAEPHAYQYPRISPDGRRVAFDVREEQSDIRVWDMAGQTLTRLTFEQEDNYYPAWTPDSARIAYTSGRNIGWKASNNTGIGSIIARDPGKGSLESDPYFFTPDASKLVFRENSHPETKDNIGMIGIDGKAEPQWLLRSPFNERNAELSANGRWIAYQSDETGRWEIYVQPFPNLDGGRWQVSNGGGIEPLWSRNGNELFYIAFGTTKLMSAEFTATPDFSVRNRRELFSVTPYLRAIGRNYDVSLDGKRFLMIKGATAETNIPPPKIIVILNWVEELKSRLD